MLHFVTSYMKQNKNRKQTLESAQYGLENSFKTKFRRCTSHEPNRMQMRENKGFCSFSFDSAHVKYDV